MKNIVILILALCVLGILVKIKLNIGLAIFVSAFSILILSGVSPSRIPNLLYDTIFNKETIYLIMIVITITYFAEILKTSGFLNEMVNNFSSFFSPKVFIPLFAFIIGALPMPGGALVSAPLIEKGSEHSKLTNSEKTAINFWFRHIWEPTSPLYPEMILASSILGVSIIKIIGIQWIYSFLMFVTGIIFFLPLIKVNEDNKKPEKDKNILGIFTSTLPILIVILLILLFKISIVFSGIIGILYVIIVKKVGIRKLIKAFNAKLLLKLAFLMYAIMFLKSSVKISGVITGVYSYLNTANVPHSVILFALPFVVSLMTGAASATIGVSYPLLLPLLKTPSLNTINLLIAFLGGWSALMLTPTHLCLSLSMEYFEAKPERVYKLLIKGVLFLLVSSIIYICVLKLF